MSRPNFEQHSVSTFSNETGDGLMKEDNLPSSVAEQCQNLAETSIIQAQPESAALAAVYDSENGRLGATSLPQSDSDSFDDEFGDSLNSPEGGAAVTLAAEIDAIVQENGISQIQDGSSPETRENFIPRGKFAPKTDTARQDKKDEEKKKREEEKKRKEQEKNKNGKVKKT